MAHDTTSALDRRGVLGATGSLVLGGLAGCTGGESSDDATTADTSTADATTADPATADATTADTSTDDAAVVEVGPDGEFVFSPGTEEPLRIDAETTVEFVWKSDTHNVAVEETPDDADWNGHEGIEDTGFEYSHTFTVPGRYEYVCTPHEGMGMIGAIVVE